MRRWPPSSPRGSRASARLRHRKPKTLNRLMARLRMPFLIQINALRCASLQRLSSVKAWNPLRDETFWGGGVNITTPFVASEEMTPPYRPRHKVRFITATSNFDGHDAAINIMRRILQARRRGDPPRPQPLGRGDRHRGHPGGRPGHRGHLLPGRPYRVLQVHDRSAARRPAPTRSRCSAAAAESSCRRRCANCTSTASRVFIRRRTAQTLGLQGMINDVIRRADCDLARRACPTIRGAALQATGARWPASSPPWRTTYARSRSEPRSCRRGGRQAVPVLGITGTGGAGKSSLTDELIRRFRLDQQDELRIAVHRGRPVAAAHRRRAARRPHPHERDRLRQHLHALARDAGRRHGASPMRCPTSVAACKASRLRPDHGRDLRHRPGRRGDRAAGRHFAVRDDARVRRGDRSSRRSTCSISPTSSPSTSSTASGAEDALRDVRKQYQRNRASVRPARPTNMPVFGTMAARFNDDGVTALYQAIARRACASTA